MGKGALKAAVRFGPGFGTRHRCLACKQPISYGERCEGCKRELRQRHKRKPR
jgi:predicted amidophosphoribosyltransferase